MSVLIQQATLRQIKALAKRLQAVIPSVLNTGPVSLHQAQAIVAKGLGHADFHAAQTFHEGRPDGKGFPLIFAPTECPSFIKNANQGVLVGPPEAIIELLMQKLGRAHASDWPYFLARRGLITAAVHSAWGKSSGASLTPNQIIEAQSLDGLLHDAKTWRHPAVSLYVNHLHRHDGSHAGQPMGEAGCELYGMSAMEWARILMDLSPKSVAGGSFFQSVNEFEAWRHIRYPHSESLPGSAGEVANQLSGELAASMSAQSEGSQMWSGRSVALMTAVVHGLLPLLLQGAVLTRGHVLDAMDLTRLAVMAHHQTVLPPAIKQAVRAYLHSIPGYPPVSTDENEYLGSPSEMALEQHAYVTMQWVPILRRFTAA